MKPNSFSKLWVTLIGDPEDFKKEHRAFNAVSVLSLIMLALMLAINVILELEVVAIACAIVMALLGIVYFLSRVDNNYKLGKTFFAFISYCLFTVLFFYNSGSRGPIIYHFFLSFQLILAFSNTKRHLLWMLLHIAVVSSLLIFEYYQPERIPDVYKNRSDQFIDLLTSGIAVIIGIYFITKYLRSSYDREKKNADERAELIIAQNVQLNKLNQEKTKILSILGHDLRSPLNSITTVLNFLTNYPLPEEHRQRLQKELLDTTRNTSEMLLNLLSWSSEQMNGIEPKLISVNVQMAFQKVLENQQLMARSKEVNINAQIADDLHVLADYNMIEVVLRNIINNAIKFTAPMGVVTITAGKSNDCCLIAIRDTGIGMSEEQMSALFTMDIHSTYGTNNEKGIGLGLVLCKEFTEMQGGKIWVESKIGLGSVFQLSLPLSNPKSAS